MEAQAQAPQTLQQAIRYFSDPDVCLQFTVKLRWPNGVTCPKCQSKRNWFLQSRRIWKCQECNQQFSVRVGTIFEDSPLGLDKWLAAIWLIANAKNGISSWELHRALGITQKTAWFVLHRIRLAMQTGTFEKLSGQVEVDETYIGGKARNMHAGKRKAKGRGAVGKAIVVGLLERKGKVRAKVVKNTKRETLHAEVTSNVESGAAVFTDALPSYNGLESAFAHQVIDHAEKYVDGQVHTNGIENFWSLLKRAIKGTYVSVEPFHLFRYLDEETFRFNNRQLNDAQRFTETLTNIAGRRLTYQQLTGNVSQEGSYDQQNPQP